LTISSLVHLNHLALNQAAKSSIVLESHHSFCIASITSSALLVFIIHLIHIVFIAFPQTLLISSHHLPKAIFNNHHAVISSGLVYSWLIALNLSVSSTHWLPHFNSLVNAGYFSAFFATLVSTLVSLGNLAKIAGALYCHHGMNICAISPTRFVLWYSELSLSQNQILSINHLTLSHAAFALSSSPPNNFILHSAKSAHIFHANLGIQSADSTSPPALFTRELPVSF
jgi:hypothetical protein